ncbi:MAG: SIR2 family protein [Gallionellaceae bacterium]|nr:SIR2 family protein [Gallionellaceae bacterium]
MNPEIKAAIQNGKLILLLGAGASCSSHEKDGTPLKNGAELAQLLATEAGLAYQNESLAVTYSAAKRKLGDGVDRLFERCYKHTKPSTAYQVIARFPWPRIYTLNIDDALEIALQTSSQQNIDIQHRNDRIKDLDPFFERLDYVKLNGSVARLSDGVIFSPQEYGAASASSPLWYQELSQDFFRFRFLFVGTKLAEPLFYHQIERYRRASQAREGLSFVLTRNATEIEKGNLADLNLEHISGTIDQFAEWLEVEFKTVPTPWDIAANVHPQLRFLTKRSDSPEFVSLFEKIIRVGRREMAADLPSAPGKHQIRDFYRGFKPNWRDIVDEVPAELKHFDEAKKRLMDLQKNDHLFVVYGPAGSGKTTTIMQLALVLSDQTDYPVYFLIEPVANIKQVLNALEESNTGRYFILFDRLSMVADSVYEILEACKLQKGVIVATERQNVWNSRIQGSFEKWCTASFHTSTINNADADKILVKLEKYGPWKRLSKMSPQQRRDELLKKAQRQLLIGLMEATSGYGFEKIIENDYAALGERAEKMFVVLVGLGTIHRLPILESIASRALPHLGVSSSISYLLSRTSGIVSNLGDALYARHPIYIERLFEISVTNQEKYDAISALLLAFSVYPKPLIKSVGRSSGTIFKWVINHGFLKNTLQGDHELILRIYASFAKAFEDDGLYWLQYGLALRDANQQDEALEKLRIAREAYRIKQTEHAYAQQLFIIAEATTSKAKAYSYLSEAKEILEYLDKSPEVVETDYPLVTLSEHHTKIVTRFEGSEAGKAIAKYYANLLHARIKANICSDRVTQAWKTLALFSSTGVWSEE